MNTELFESVKERYEDDNGYHAVFRDGEGNFRLDICNPDPDLLLQDINTVMAVSRCRDDMMRSYYRGDFGYGNEL